MSAKAIKTEYKGYEFRSRTEARWAVFFDTLGLRWEYEPEGYEVGRKKIRYLPDFYLSDWDKFVEIKPLRKIDVKELEKAGLLVQYEGKPVLFLFGRPWPGEYLTGLILPCNDPAIEAPFTAALIPPEKTGQFGIAPHSKRLYLHYKDGELPLICLNLDLVVDSNSILMLTNTDNISFLSEDTEKGIHFFNGYAKSIKDLLKFDTLLNRAYIAATRSRFEFSESGKSIDEALKLYNPSMKGAASYFNPKALANARAIENQALKGKSEIERPYIIGECISAWVQPGATVSVTRGSRGIRFREYKNIFYLSQGETLMVIDIKTEDIFNSFSQAVGPSLDDLIIARIEYDNSYHIISIVQGEE